MAASATQLVSQALRIHWLRNRGQLRFILAVSGGVDSMVLLEGMARLCETPEDRERVKVVHVNHGLRGTESEGDEFLVLARGRELGFEVSSYSLSWLGEKPSQNRCRQRREEIFRSLCRTPQDRVVLAHHLNDQAETVFFRLLRGTGAKGLRGMRPRAGVKLRPFLALEKQVLEDAAREWGVRWREDSSNRKPEAYERNWLRLKVIPLLERRRPGFQRRLAALAEEAAKWKLAKPLPLFTWETGVQFARPRAGVSAAVLGATFPLSRQHANALAGLLKKSSGRLEAKGIRFTWSAGVLLAERGASFEGRLSTPERATLHGSLGKWSFSSESLKDDVLGKTGERGKKEFQSLRVPVFFRGAVPMISQRGRPMALLPERISRSGRSKEIQFTPSPLAQWWLKL